MAMHAAGLNGAAKLKEVTSLMGKLSSDIKEETLQPEQRDSLLEQLKVFGRDPTNADPIFTREGIRVLSQYAFSSSSRTTSQNAMRCLANAMLLKPETRDTFLSLGVEGKACGIMKNDSRDDEFLASRIIFLATYSPNVKIEPMIEQHQLAETVCTNLERHAAQYGTEHNKTANLNPMEDMALTETLKLLFNLTNFCPQRSAEFSRGIPHILRVLSKRPIPASKPLDPPVGPLVNSLINLPLDSPESINAIFPSANPSVHTNRMIEILDISTKAYQGEELEHLILPLVTLLRRVYEQAPDGVKSSMQEKLLPSQKDRLLPLGKSDSLSSRLLHLSSTATMTQVRESVSNFLYELSNKDAERFVQNVGYGFASGYLFQHKIPVPENALEGGHVSNGESGTAHESWTGRVNPITGQLLDEETTVDEVEMTQEEREREAERLFVLFERLRATGVVNVENPVTAARQQGRFEELPDDADSD